MARGCSMRHEYAEDQWGTTPWILTMMLFWSEKPFYLRRPRYFLGEKRGVDSSGEVS